ncbi:hypothetical protein PHJA_000305300 [Phtheirospermum japonicum]|uniref:Myb-like domain-containing protein n=1 Tax=Phtheirospermum japonicum TaxID=374723 RepID=A0A830B1V8_9LAMI|nr:hypothetical protein PHJA_000305300 [Phtheirospermum japonicum]
MVDKSKKRKKGSIGEENISTVLRRYSVNTVLSLLQEVSQAAGEKINWHEMVKNTATGISGAREYQMLWRHLAYGEALVDQIDHDQNPMDDGSDLEYELEAFPAPGREASAEAAACVKVLVSSGYANDSPLPNNSTIEAPLSISVPNSKALSAPSDSSLLANARQWTNITIPVSLQKVPSSSGLSGEKRPANEASGVNVPSRRKRRCWSTAEDLKLTAAVNNNVEPNWVDIARVNFNDDRKSTELSQRWSTLKKKQGNLKMGVTSQHPEAQLAAAHRAMSLALDMPMSDNLKAASGISVGIKSQQQPRKPAAPPDQPLGRGGPPKSQVPTKRPPMNPTPTPDSMVKAAAVAAGARIASSADASSLLEAARSPNVVHITTGGGGSSLMRPSGTNITSQLPSNVHFIRNGLAKAAISKNSTAKPNNILHPGEAQRAQQGQPAVKPAVVVPTSGNNVIKEVVKSNQVADRAESQSEKVEKHVKPDGEAKDDQVALPSSEAEDNSGKVLNDAFLVKRKN